MIEITPEDCVILKEKLINYTEHAEVYEFPKLAMIENKMENTDFETTSQEDLRAMFRVVLKTIGEDYSKYKE